MTEPILCTVAMALLMWVVLLKCQIDELRRVNRKLRGALRRDLDDITSGVKVSGSRRERTEFAPDEPPPPL